jgi:hypothetical protein
MRILCKQVEEFCLHNMQVDNVMLCFGVLCPVHKQVIECFHGQSPSLLLAVYRIWDGASWDDDDAAVYVCFHLFNQQHEILFLAV